MFDFNPPRFSADLDALFSALRAASDIHLKDLDAVEAALRQGRDVLVRAEREPDNLDPDAVTEIADYMLELFDNLLAGVHAAGRRDLTPRLARLAVPVSTWVARNGGEISRLEPVVDGFASLANELSSPESLTAMCVAMGTVMDAVDEGIRADLDNSNPGRPWRVLNLNRCIVATRTHDPAVMEEAFARLEGNLPQDAPGFFREGMEQMHIVGYPEHVRAVMQRYHDRWQGGHRVH
ncbi:MAG: hypothetical protein H6981_13600 [Gammaproteobacteria bacterium]|nr:hypothetical protein [Gammaproteobacteria bacterium]MCP5137825.1 hypothetical protein [Gammaproteobacteria bacterium]